MDPACVEEFSAEILSAPRALTVRIQNPATRSVQLRVGVPQSGGLSLNVFDIAGRKVATRSWEHLAVGFHDLELPLGAQLRAGIYLASVRLGAARLERRFVLLP